MIDKGQRGFTLIEVIVAMGITALLLPVIATSIYQIIKGTAYNNNKVTAMEDIESAANWVARDVSQAQSTDLANPGSANHFRVDWIDLTGWGDGGAHYSEYTLQGTRLLRNHDGTVTAVARYVSNIVFSRSGNLISMSITSDVPGGSPRTENLSYNFTPRTDGGLQ